MPRIREADELLRQSDLLAAFEYVGQPCSLTARIVPRQPRISVDPEYVYYVDNDDWLEPEALGYVNPLRRRAGVPDNSLTSLTRDRIRKERWSELAEWARGCDLLVLECSLPTSMAIAS